MSYVSQYTENLINTGNAFNDIVANLVEILRREQTEDSEQKLTYIKRKMNVYDYDVFTVPSTPCIAVSLERFDEEVTTIGQTSANVIINSYVDIYYYHSELDVKVKKKDIIEAMWELARILRRNADLNGLSRIGATSQGGEVLNRARVGSVFSGAKITLKVPVHMNTRRGVTS